MTDLEGSPMIEDAERNQLAALADQLIPAADGIPSASGAGAHTRGLDALLAARPDLGRPLAAVLASVAGLDAPVAIARLRADPEGWGVLTTVVPAAYFLIPEVRERVGYPGQQAIPFDRHPPADETEEELLASVRARAPVYRPTP
jgi:hypothetical protein